MQPGSEDAKGDGKKEGGRPAAADDASNPTRPSMPSVFANALPALGDFNAVKMFMQ